MYNLDALNYYAYNWLAQSDPNGAPVTNTATETAANTRDWSMTPFLIIVVLAVILAAYLYNTWDRDHRSGTDTRTNSNLTR